LICAVGVAVGRSVAVGVGPGGAASLAWLAATVAGSGVGRAVGGSGEAVLAGGIVALTSGIADATALKVAVAAGAAATA